MFQFPSNGKAYPKKCRFFGLHFKALSFNSLQTGKPIQSDSETVEKLNDPNEVSIPFKRESLSKAVLADMITEVESFNSLQTGKPIQRQAASAIVRDFGSCFNSLQTGKPIQSETFYSDKK